MTRHVLVALAALIAGGVIAHFHVAAQSYRPVVRVETPDGVTYTAVLDAVAQRPACGAAGQRFVAPIAADCPECKVVFARCRREGEGLPAFVQGETEASSFVRMPGVSIRIDAAPETAQRNCRLIADSVSRLGVAAARCVVKASNPHT